MGVVARLGGPSMAAALWRASHAVAQQAPGIQSQNYGIAGVVLRTTDSCILCILSTTEFIDSEPYVIFSFKFTCHNIDSVASLLEVGAMEAH